MQPKATIGRIFQISSSHGGVPKQGQLEAQLTESGIIGDVHRNLKYHGGPDRALCLYSLEKILALQEEQHPIFPGAIGENLTITGLDWRLLEPGARLRLGDLALIEITSFTTPCQHIAPFFLDKDMNRVSQKQHPGWSRVYAKVLMPGILRVGERVELLPPQT